MQQFLVRAREAAVVSEAEANVMAVRSISLGAMILAGLAHEYRVMWASCAVFCVSTLWAQHRARVFVKVLAHAEVLAESERAEMARRIVDASAKRYAPRAFSRN